MKKKLIVFISFLSTFFWAGCSLDNSTSIGSDVMKDINPSLLDFSKNFKSFSVDTSIVQKTFSVPDNDDVSFGVHTGTSMPVGGRDREKSTGYIEFRTSYAALQDFKEFDSIHSVSIVFGKSGLGRADCNYEQKINVFLADSTYKFNRKEVDIERLTKNSNRTPSPINTNFVCDFIDTGFYSSVLKTCVSGLYKDNKKQDSLFKADTFRFVIAPENFDNRYAYLYSLPVLKIHTKFGGLINDPTSDTSTSSITMYDTTFDADYEDTSFASTDTTYKKLLTAETFRDTTVDSIGWIDSLCTKIVKTDTLNLVDSIKHVTRDSVFNKIVRTFVSQDTTSNTSGRIVKTLLNVTSIHKKSILLKVKTKKYSSRTYSLPVSYSNYVITEKAVIFTDTNITRKAYSAYGPQRTAVFQINADTLWKKLREAPDSAGYKFSEILSAGISIKGTVNSDATKELVYQRNDQDSLIAFRWFISDYLYDNGVALHAKYRTWATSDTLRSGKEITLPIEKYLQELSPLGKPSVYLYIELKNNSDYWKEVIWSKPVLKTVLTTLN